MASSKMRSRKYVEDSFITAPATGTGLQRIGDLWDCRNTKALGMNLFGNSLTSADQVAYPRKNLNYCLKHIKKTKDGAFTIGVGIEMSLTVLFIKMNQKGTYENIKETTVRNDEIEFTYNVETFSVKCANSASSRVSENVLRQISTEGSPGDLRATHVCVETVVGGQLKGKIIIEKTKVENKKREKSDLFAKLALMPLKLAIDAMAKGLGAVFGDKSKDAVTFTQESKPAISTQPKSVQEMFSLIDNLDNLIAAEKNYPHITEYDVTGVELRFIMAPVSTFLSPSIRSNENALKLYEEIEEDLKNSYLDMMMTLWDYQRTDFIKRQIIDGSLNERLRKILVDKENLVTEEITKREMELKKLSEELMDIAEEVFRKYRFAQKTSGDIEAVIEDFNVKFNATELFHEMLQFRNKVKEEYRTIEGNKKDGEVDNRIPKIVTFTNISEVENWLESGNTDKVKILIQTSYDCGESGNFLRGFWELEENLWPYPVLIGIAVPSIFKKSLIRIKNGSKEKTYEEDKINFVLEVLSVAVGKGSSWQSKTFHDLNAALDGIILPLRPDNFGELNNLLENLDGVRQTKICSSYLQLQDLLTSSERENRYQFVTTLEAEDTAYDAVKHLKLFRSMLSSRVPTAYAKSDWIIGDFGLFDYNEAPVLFFFRNNQLLAICFDNLDLLILTEILQSSEHTNEDPDLTMLSPTQMDIWDSKWLYPNRVTFAKEVSKFYGYRFQESELENFQNYNSSVEPFDFTENDLTVDTIRFLRDCLSNDKLQIISSVANACLRHFCEENNDVSYILKKHGWDSSKKAFTIDFFELEKELSLLLKDLQTYSSTLSPFHAKILFYIKELEKAIRKENYESLDIDSLLKEIIGEDELPDDIKRELEGFSRNASGVANGWPLGISFQVKGVHNILQKFSAKAQRDGEDKEFYLKALVGLAAQISKPNDAEINVSNIENPDKNESELNGNESFQGLMELALEYVSRLDLSHTEYPLGKEKVIKHLSNNEIFQALSILTRCKYNGYNYLILHEMNEIPSLGDGLWLTEFVRKLGRAQFENATKPGYQIFWENPKFKYLMSTGVDTESLLEALYIFQCETKGMENIPLYFPKEFANRLREVAFQRQDFLLDVEFNTVAEFSGYLQTIFTKGVIPSDFMLKMTRALLANVELREELLEKSVLYYWDESEKIFTESWDSATVLKAIDILVATSGEIDTHKQIITRGKYNWNIPVKYSSGDTIQVIGPLTEICGNSLSVITANEYQELSEVVEYPELSKYKVFQWMSIILPFVAQRLRMKSIKEFINDYFLLSPKFPEGEKPNYSLVSRGEIQTCLMSVTEPEVTLDILQHLSEFPIAIPLLTQNISEQGQFLFFHHLLSQVEIKYMPKLDNKPDEILKTKLFHGKPRIIVLAELGQHSKPNVTNRILKPLLSPESKGFFTSETSLGTYGSVEFTWLTYTNCSESFWKSTVKRYYTRDYKDPIILAKIHGNAMNNPAMAILGQMASCIMVLLMPQEWEDMRASWKNFRDNLGRSYRNFVKVMIDPVESCLEHANEASKLQLELLTNGDESEKGKLNNLFEEAILFRGKSYDPSEFVFNSQIVPKGDISSSEKNQIFQIMDSSLNMDTQGLDLIFQNISRIFPNLKVFVVGILGFKSSGKSTLLNSIFGTKFEENTEGMLFQFAFLNDDLKKKLYADAILVIDSQGLTSTKTVRKSVDRKLASLVLSVSNLCIVNVMGPSMKELKNIMSVALVSQMRIKNSVENYPMIMLTEQSPPGKSPKISANLAELIAVVEMTIELCNERETDLGLRVRTSQRILNTIVNTKVWDVLKTFRKYGSSKDSKIITPPSHEYHEDILAFYKILLKNLKTAPAPILFSEWVEMLKNNRAVLVDQDFNSRFDNMEDLQSYFGHVDSFRRVKDYYDSALRVHQINLETEYMTRNEEDNISTLIKKIGERLQLLPDICEELYSRDGDCGGNSEKCLRSLELRDRVMDVVKGHSYQTEFEERLGVYKRMVSEHSLHKVSQKLVVTRMNELILISTESKKEPTTKILDIQAFLDIFSEKSDYENVDMKAKEVYAKLHSLVAAKNFVIPAFRLYTQEIAMEYEFAPHLVKHLEDKAQLDSLPELENLQAFDVEQKDSGVFVSWAQKEWLQKELDLGAQEIHVFARDSKGEADIYAYGMARKWRLRIDEIIDEFQEKCRKVVLIDFRWAIHEYGVKILGRYMEELQKQWDQRYLPLSILSAVRTEVIDELETWVKIQLKMNDKK